MVNAASMMNVWSLVETQNLWLAYVDVHLHCVLVEGGGSKFKNLEVDLWLDSSLSVHVGLSFFKALSLGFVYFFSIFHHRVNCCLMESLSQGYGLEFSFQSQT
jgi:hypothetical protein